MKVLNSIHHISNSIGSLLPLGIFVFLLPGLCSSAVIAQEMNKEKKQQMIKKMQKQEPTATFAFLTKERI